ncbi:MAG: protein jag [Oscillospiraceae bacterium]|nr:protein jag [Oscillospiraceae bacterium]
MTKFIEVTGKTEDEALASALAQLELSRDEVSVEILERAKSGFLGIGAAPARIRVSYEVVDTQRDKVERYLRGLLDYMGVEANIEISERDNGGLIANLSGNGMGAVIGRRGETLDAIQHLVNYSVNRGNDKRMHISVDAENYRSKREESLVHLAEKMAAKAVKYKRSMALEPMNSYERHVIHTALQNYVGVSTSSTGTEPNRRVVVSYEKPEVQSNKPVSREWA